MAYIRIDSLDYSGNRFERNLDAIEAVAEMSPRCNESNQMVLGCDARDTESLRSRLVQWTGFGSSDQAKRLWDDSNVSQETRDARNAMYRGTTRYSFPSVEERQALQDRERIEMYHPRLRALGLSIYRLDALRQSTLNAHYTPPDTWRAIWSHLEALGLRAHLESSAADHTLQLLEPSAGIGTAVSTMPEWLMGYCDSCRAKWTCVELEGYTAAICKGIQPDATVYQCGIQDAALPPGAFDLIVSNVPFGDYGVTDATIDARITKPIHDYFFAKALQLCRVGGIVAFVTSHYSFNKAESKFRRYIHKHANLLDLVMLPSSMFQKNAGTEVVTCVAFFQRVATRDTVVHSDSDALVAEVEADQTNLPYRKRRQKYGDNGSNDAMCARVGVDTNDAALPDWCSVTLRSLQGRWSAESINVNKWFDSRECNIFGSLDAKGTMYGGGASLNVTMDRDAAIAAWAALIQSDAYRVSRINSIASDSAAIAPIVSRASTRDNDLHVTEDPRYSGLMRIFDAAQELLQSQQNGDSYQAAQAELNAAYDQFVFQYGPLTKPLKRGRTNLACLNDSSVAQFLSALETEEFQKSPLFTECCIGSESTSIATNASDALYQSLDRFGRIDLDWMAQVLHMDRQRVIEDLGDAVYHVHPGWNGDMDTAVDRDTVVTADEYLSGDVGERLAAAYRWAALDPERYARNVGALEAALPMPVLHTEIMVRLGTPWIPVDVVEAFVQWLAGDPYATVRHSDTDWEVRTEWRYSSPDACDPSVHPMSLCTGRVSIATVLHCALNGTVPEVYDRMLDGTTAKNVAETQLAVACVAEAQRVFRGWVWRDEARTQRLVTEYNRTYNTIVPRRFNGDHLSFPGLSVSFVPRWYQRAAIARVMGVASGQASQVCIAHTVGYGKTADAIIASRKLLQIGAVKRVLLVVKKSLRATWRNALAALYPLYLDRVRFCDGDDFGKGRTRFTAEIVSGKYDTIVMTYEQFQKVPLSHETVAAFVSMERDEIEAKMLAAKRAGVDAKSAKQFAKAMQKVTDRLLGTTGKVKRDDRQWLTFEQLGCDMVVADEAHVWKRDLVFTKQQGIKGINTVPSQRSIDARMKAQWALRHNCRWVELTGTPVSNSLVEAFVVQRRLQEPLLRAKRIDSFDAWSGVFTEAVDSMERTVSGEYQMVRRLIFDNLPELNQLLGDSWDRVAAVDAIASGGVDATNALKIPSMHGGQIEVIETIATAELCRFTRSLADRKKKLKRSEKGKDNHLLIDSDGRKSAYLNGDPHCGWDPKRQTKVDSVVARVVQYYRQYHSSRGVQAIFCDMFTPDKCAPIASYASEAAVFKSEGLYGVIRMRLVQQGIPESEIAYIHEAEDDEESEELESQLNCGDKRVIIGSTGKMGEGRNIQQRLCALHHLDCPWTPKDLEQRNGRVLRHGNQYAQVHICAYVTQQSYDIIAWQIVRAKARFLQQISANAVSQRRSEDVGDLVITAEMAMALAMGDQRIVIRAERENQLRLLSLQYAEYRQTQTAQQQRIDSLPHEIQAARESLVAYEALAAECGKVLQGCHGDGVQLSAAFGIRVTDASELYQVWQRGTIESTVWSCGRLRLRARTSPFDDLRIVLHVSLADSGVSVRQEIHKRPNEAFEWLTRVLNDPSESISLTRRTLAALETEWERVGNSDTSIEWNKLSHAQSVYTEYLQLCVDLESHPDLVCHAFASASSDSLTQLLEEMRRKKEEREAQMRRSEAESRWKGEATDASDSDDSIATSAA